MSEGGNLYCSICRARNAVQCFAKKGHTYWKCPRCGLVRLYPVPGGDDLADVYDAVYFEGMGMEEAGDSESSRTMKRKSFDRLFGVVERFRKPAALLDVGCAAGYLLEEAQKRGWSVHGVEISPYAAGMARKKFGASIAIGKFEKICWPEKSFDVVIMSDVLEHFIDPDSAMQKAGYILKPGGILVIITPDTESFSARVLSSRWSHYQKDHLFYFSRRNIVPYLDRWHFTTVHVGRHTKFFNLSYLRGQSDLYGDRALRTFISLINRLTFGRLEKINFPLSSGDMLVIARRDQQEKGAADETRT